MLRDYNTDDAVPGLAAFTSREIPNRALFTASELNEADS